MRVGLVLATFALVVPAELPDKTFVSCVVLGARYRPVPVWCGAAAGLVLQAGVGSAAGRLLSLAPRRVVDAVVAALLCAGAVYLLASREEREEAEGGELASREERSLGGAAEPSGLRIAATTFVVVALAELGDLTQVLIANLSARYRDPLSV
ncbi:MAG: TMEM165/GDT1 family protein, partial [Actinomycetota bacterium]|nr:TMEM165/GDT1 family protein [Actinomycetota bacterium]